MSNLAQRILVAIIGIPLVIYLCFMPYSLLGLVVILSGITVHEYYGLAKVKGFIPQVEIGIITTILIVLAYAPFRVLSPLQSVLPPRIQTTDLLPLFLIFGVIATFIAELRKGYPNPMIQIAITLAGAVYIGVGLGCFYGVHEYFYWSAGSGISLQNVQTVKLEAGAFTIATLASIWICDTAAFALGRKLGKTKISERVSPNKTYEGASAGLVFAILTWFAARAFVPPLATISVTTCIVMGCIVGIMGQVGDFAESLMKRDVGVKDSSSLLPGHGGMLDRLDSILFVFPLTYLYLHLFGV